MTALPLATPDVISGELPFPAAEQTFPLLVQPGHRSVAGGRPISDERVTRTAQQKERPPIKKSGPLTGPLS